MIAAVPAHPPGQAELRKLLESFDVISLADMDRVKLMERTDTKFVVPSGLLESILSRVRPDYFALEVSGVRISRYETLYYDTDNFGMYSDHHSGRATRVKVRARKYVESDLCFFEVKHKTNRGRTIKKRIRTEGIDHTPGAESHKLLAETANMDSRLLKGRIWVDYGRITLVSRGSAERATLDVNMHFRIDGRVVDMSRLAIVEVKREQGGSRSAIVDVLKEMRVKEGSISKYCLGLALGGARVKTNNFKEKIRLLNSIVHAH